MDPTNRNTALASALVEELARSGVRTAVVSPGSRSTPPALALRRQDEILAETVIDERSAGFFALGAAQATGVPAIVLCTSGTAAANLHPAVCEADEAAVPLVVLTADRPPELRDVGAGQTIDQLKLYGSAVRWFCEVGTQDADDSGLLHVRSVACRAVAAASGDPRPGPVHLNLSWREPLGVEPAEGEVTATSELALRGRGERPLTAVTPASGLPAPELLDALRHRLDAAERPLLVVGRHRDPTLAEPLVGLAAAAGAPLMAEPTSQLRFGPHSRDAVISTYDAIARAAPSELEPDLVLRFGDMPTSKALRLWLSALEDAPQLVVDPTGGWNEPTRRAGAVLRADPVALATALAQGLERSKAGWQQLWSDADRLAAAAIDTTLAETQELNEPAVHRWLGAAYRDRDLVYTASSMPIRDQEAFAAGTAAEVLFLANRGANGIDGLVSSGIGAGVASGSPSWILTGDLGLFHDLNSLSLLRHGEAPQRVVVFNNRGGGIFEFLPQAGQINRTEFEAIFGTPSGLEPERAAELWGVKYRRLETLGDLGSRELDETELIEVPVDRRASVALHRRLNEAAATALTALA